MPSKIVSRRTSTLSAANAGSRARRALAAAVEPLEDRRLLTVLVGWDVGSLPGGSGLFGASPFAATVTDSSVNGVVGLTRGAGVGTTGTAAAAAWGGNDWQSTDYATAVNTGDFFTFGLTVAPGKTASLTSVDAWNVRHIGSGPNTGELAYSLNGGAFVANPSGIVVGGTSTLTASNVVETSGTVTITINLSEPAAVTTTVQYATSDGTHFADATNVDGAAVAGRDYTPASGTLTFFAVGQSTKTLVVPLIDVKTFEGVRKVNLSLYNTAVSGAFGGKPGSFDVYLLTADNDPPAPSPSTATSAPTAPPAPAPTATPAPPSSAARARPSSSAPPSAAPTSPDRSPVRSTSPPAPPRRRSPSRSPPPPSPRTSRSPSRSATPRSPAPVTSPASSPRPRPRSRSTTSARRTSARTPATSPPSNPPGLASPPMARTSSTSSSPAPAPTRPSASPTSTPPASTSPYPRARPSAPSTPSASAPSPPPTPAPAMASSTASAAPTRPRA